MGSDSAQRAGHSVTEQGPLTANADSATVRTRLDAWSHALEQAIAAGSLTQATQLAGVVLRHQPRHLATYAKLLRVAWMARRWQEGADLGRRLLRADPNNALAWQLIARNAEEEDNRGQAHAIWQRAFEISPYSPEIRAGLSRTQVATGESLALNRAALASLYLRSYRWRHASALYSTLIDADPRRVDFQAGYLVALWRQRQDDAAYELARHLVDAHAFLLLAWTVIRAIGDENDRALSQHPIQSMDPDGDYVRSWFRLEHAPRSEARIGNELTQGPAFLTVSEAESEFLQPTV